MSSGLGYHSELIDFQLVDHELVFDWIQQIVLKHKRKIRQIDFIFCSDEFLLELNVKHLNHDTYTDVITFPFQSEGELELFGDVFVSIDRVRENAKAIGVSFVDELHRVMIHGILHLLGFQDGNPKEKDAMTRQEEIALSLRMF